MRSEDGGGGGSGGGGHRGGPPTPNTRLRQEKAAKIPGRHRTPAPIFTLKRRGEKQLTKERTILGLAAGRWRTTTPPTCESPSTSTQGRREWGRAVRHGTFSSIFKAPGVKRRHHASVGGDGRGEVLKQRDPTIGFHRAEERAVGDIHKMHPTHHWERRRRRRRRSQGTHAAPERGKRQRGGGGGIRENGGGQRRVGRGKRPPLRGRLLLLLRLLPVAMPTVVAVDDPFVLLLLLFVVFLLLEGFSEREDGGERGGRVWERHVGNHSKRTAKGGCRSSPPIHLSCL